MNCGKNTEREKNKESSDKKQSVDDGRLVCLMCLRDFPDVFPSFQESVVRSCPFCLSIHVVRNKDYIKDVDYFRRLRVWKIFMLSKSSLGFKNKRFCLGNKCSMPEFMREINVCKRMIRDYLRHPLYYMWRKGVLVRKSEEYIKILDGCDGDFGDVSGCRAFEKLVECNVEFKNRNDKEVDKI